MYEIIGIERVQYKSKSGREVSGYAVYFNYDPPEGALNYQGRLCDDCFVGDDLFAKSGITVGSPAMPVYDKRGRVTGFMESPL